MTFYMPGVQIWQDSVVRCGGWRLKYSQEGQKNNQKKNLSCPAGLTNLWSGRKEKKKVEEKLQSKTSAGYRGFWQMTEKNQVNKYWGGVITGIRNRCVCVRVWLHRCITARMGIVTTKGRWWHEQALRITSKQNKLSAKQVKTNNNNG